VHGWAVPVLLDMLIQSLHALTPGHSTNFITLHIPGAETIEAFDECTSTGMIHQVDESISEASLMLEVNRKVEEVVVPSETLIVHKLQELSPCETVGDVPHHQCRLLAAIVACFIR